MMNQPIRDPRLIHFLNYYTSGQFLEALQIFISHPEISYDDYQNNDSLLRFLLNYLDAALFEDPVTAIIIIDKQLGPAVSEAIKQETEHQFMLIKFLAMLYCENFLLRSQLTNPEHLFHLTDIPSSIHTLIGLLKFEYPEWKDKIVQLRDIFSLYKPLIEKKQEIWKKWIELKSHKPHLEKMIHLSTQLALKFPCYPFNYNTPLNAIVNGSSASFPLIFLEPLLEHSGGADYHSLLSPYENRQALLIFPSANIFFEMLQFEAVFKSLQNPLHFIYFLDQYPSENLASQEIPQISEDFQILLTNTNHEIETFLPSFTQALKEVLKQPKSDSLVDTEANDTLFYISKKILFNLKAHRLGKERFISLNILWEYKQWFESHKGLPNRNRDLGPAKIDFLSETYVARATQRNQKKWVEKSKIRVAHIVPQIINESHAPTQLLMNIVRNTDLEKFEIYIFSTERLQDHPLEYPISTAYKTESSLKRGGETIQELQSLGVKVAVNPHTTQYIKSASELSAHIASFDIDIAIFHGPDEVNNLTSSLCHVPLRVLFEHGTLPKHPCYDLVIISTLQSQSHQFENLERFGTKILSLFFSVDPRRHWEETPYPKSSLGCPDDAFIMTTISHHLATRVSLKMRQAIVQILQKCPKAYYIPIGQIKNSTQFLDYFSEHGVADRVKLIEAKDHPSQWARSMDIYLNEFPFGSCLGMLDAMAAGCAVVSMYDEEGPAQAKYAGNFLGLDSVITSGKVEDYVALACRLYTDKKFYEKASKHSLKQFEKRSDIKKYVKDLEKILLDSLHNC